MSIAQATLDQNDLTHSKSERLNRDEIQALKARDNYTNIFYIALPWAIMLLTVTGTVTAFTFVISQNWDGWGWLIPLSAIAVIIMGASQHQLGGIIHEGTHYTLFANRKASELISDWLAAFPIYTTTYAFRLHHLAHHQFVNDPLRDPNFDQAHDSGHWLDFPLTHMELLWGTLKLMWLPNLVRYTLARAKYSAIGVESNPYADKKRAGSPWAIRFGVMFVGLVPAVAIPLVALKMWLAVAIFIPAAWLALTIYYLSIPESHFAQSVINPVISHRMTSVGRFTFLGLLYGGLTLTEYLSGAPVWGYFGLLWILPLFSTFPVFMILREWLQHGNADRGRYSNTRIFLVNPFARYAIFPLGMDYHLPHHLNASVPHYNLKSFHEMMLNDKKYSEEGLIVEGWIRKPDAQSERPTIVDVLGAEYSPDTGDVHVDPSVLELAELNDKEAVDKQIAGSREDGRKSEPD